MQPNVDANTLNDLKVKTETLRRLRFNYIRQSFGPQMIVTPEFNVRLKAVGITIDQRKLTKVDEPSVLRAIAQRKGKKAKPQESDGPYLVRTTADGSRTLDDLEQLIFVSSEDVRSAVLTDLKRIAARNSLGSELKSSLAAAIELLGSKDERKIRHSLIRLVDTMRDDFWWKLLRLRQAVALKVDDAINAALEQLLRLSTACETAELERTPGRLLQERLAAVIDNTDSKIVSWPRKQIDEILLISDYIPLEANVGLGALIERVRLSSKENRKEFNTFLRKALGRSNPSLWYQVLLVALKYSRYVDKITWPLIWQRATALLPKYSTDEGKSEVSDNALVRVANVHARLLRYYFLYLESGIPTADSEQLVQLAFRFATTIVEATGYDDAFMRGLTQYLHDRINHARDVWVIASPPYSQSHLRHVVSSDESPWECLFVESLASWESGMNLKRFSAEAIRHVGEHVRLYSCDFATLAERDPQTNEHVLERWSKLFGNEHVTKWLEGAVALADKYSTPDSVFQAFAKYSTLEAVDKAVAVTRFVYFMREGRISTDTLWDEMNKPDFLTAIETSEEGLLDRIVFSFISSPRLLESEKCRQITHWFAFATLKVKDATNKSMMFHATVLLAMKCLAESAIVRMIVEDKDNKLVAAREHTIQLLTGFSDTAPPWLMGRIRAALAVL